MKLTPEYLRQTKVFQNDPKNRQLIAQATRPDRVMGSIPAKEPEQHAQQPPHKDPVLGECQAGLGYRVTIIAFCRRKMDGHDNFKYSCKPLVDRITETLGFKSDDDPRLEWKYHQIKCHGKTGCVVKIEQSHKRRAVDDD